MRSSAFPFKTTVHRGPPQSFFPHYCLSTRPPRLNPPLPILLNLTLFTFDLAVSDPAAMFQGRPQPISAREATAVIRAGDCKPVTKLGEGGMGTVCLVRTSRGQLYACKVVRNPRMHGRKVAEARLIRDVLGNGGRYITRVAHVASATPNLHGIFFEFVNGGSLVDVGRRYFARRTRLPEGFLWTLLDQIGQALFYCHTGLTLSSPRGAREWAAPVVHGDVKPDNIRKYSAPDHTSLQKATNGLQSLGSPAIVPADIRSLSFRTLAFQHALTTLITRRVVPAGVRPSTWRRSASSHLLATCTRSA